MKLHFCLLIITVTLFSSCWKPAYRNIYASQAANINYFKQKGDSKLTGYYSGDGKSKNDGYNIQGGYAITNHWALMAAYTFKQEHQTYRYDSVRFRPIGFGTYEANIFDSSVINYKRNTFELGLGYILPLNHRKTITYNLYLGISEGKYSISDAGLDSKNKNYNRFYNNKITKYFVQGSFNFMPIDLVHFSIGGKISFLNYFSVNTSYDSSELSYFFLDKIPNKTFTIWEPYFNLQFALPKYPWIKMDGQISFCSTLYAQYPRTKTFNGSVGLTIELNKLLKKKKN